jgi:hypothetical protein
VLNNGFDPDFQDYIDVPCVVVVGKEPKKTSEGVVIDGEFNNPVKGVKAAGTISATADTPEGSLL